MNIFTYVYYITFRGLPPFNMKVPHSQASPLQMKKLKVPDKNDVIQYK